MEGDPNDGTELEVYPYIKTIDREDFGVVYLAGSKWRHFRLGFSGSLTAMWRASDTSILVEIAWSIAEALVAAGAASFEVEAFLFTEDNCTSSTNATLTAVTQDFAQFRWPSEIPLE